MNGPITARHFLTEKMEHKQFTSNDMSHSPHSNQVFQADRFLKKTNQLNIPDTIIEQCSAELSGDSLKMEAPKVTTESFNNDDKENISNQQIMSNDSIKIAIDNSFIRQCERKLLNCSSSDDERSNESINKSLVNNQQLLNVSRKFNDTISTPPSLLRKEINMLRTEIAEAEEFHDLEIQLLKEEKCLNEVDSENYVELFKKYSELMQLYTVLKAEYDEYRRVQETVTRELQSKTADCLESLCSQIEASDNSLNFSSASFVSFNGGIRSSTMMEDISEVEATVMPDVTVLANDPLSITSDVFKTPVQTPLKSVGLTTPKLNSTLKKPLMKEVKEIIAKLENTAPLDSEFDIQLLNLETALCDKVKEVEELEQRLFKVEDMSLALQNEFERVGSVYTKENASLKESLSAKTEQLNELTERLFTETISLNPSLRDSLIDVPGEKLLLVFIETIMESCKKIKNEDAMTTVESLQNQLASQEIKLIELEDLKKKCENLEKELSKAEDTIVTRDEEIRLLQSHLSNVRQTREDLAAAKLTLSELESRLTLEEAEKKAAESRCSELETTIEDLKREFDIKGKIITDLQLQLSSTEEKSSEMKNENAQLKELCDSLNAQIIETEKILKSNESELISLNERLTSADGTIQQVKSQLKLAEEEKSDLENRWKELQETNENLLMEITATKDLENNPAFESMKKENVDLKEKISECEKAITELKTELSFSKESNSCKVEELVKEIEQLSNEKLSFSKALENVEESLRSLADVLCDVQYDADLSSERIIKLMADKFQEPSETREMRILSGFVETITKTCKGVQNELMKQFDAKKLEWETQKRIDVSLIENQLETKLSEAEKTVAEREEQIRNLLSDVKQIQEDFAAAKTTISGFESRLSSVETEKTDAETRCRGLEQVVEDLKHEIESKEQTRGELMKQLSVIEEKTTEIEREYIRLEESFKVLHTEKVKLEEEIALRDEEIRDLKSNECEREKKLREDLEEKRKLCESLECELSKAKTAMLDREEQIQELQSKLAQAEENYSIAKSSLTEFESQLAVLEEQKTVAETRCQGLEQVVEDLKREIESKERTRGELMKQLSVIEEKTTEIEREYIRLEESFKVLHTEKVKLEEAIALRDEEIRDLKSNECEREKKLREDLEEKRKLCQSLECELSEAKTAMLDREEQIQELQSKLAQTEENYSIAKSSFTELESRLALLEEQKSVAETRCRELENTIETLNQKIVAAEIRENELENEKAKIEAENNDLKQSVDALKIQMTETEKAISTREQEINELKSHESQLNSVKESLASADETILNLKSQLKSIEMEKSEMQNRCTELQVEIRNAKNLENNPAYGQIQTENGDLKERILESEKMMAELKAELEVAKENQMNNINQVAELIREIEELKKENSEFTYALTTIEETQKNLADVLSCPLNDSELPSERITKLIEKTSRMPDPETRETKIVSDFVETITKTCKGVQNELIKKFDNKKIEWETQKDDDIQNLQEEIKLLTEQNVKYETALKEIKEELAAADEVISKLKSELSTTQIEKVEMEVRCQKLEENTQTLQAEIDNKQTIVKELDEVKIVRQEMETENGDLKDRILESEKMMSELKAELEVAKENQMNNINKVAELIREIEELKKENSEFTYALTTIEETQKNLADVLSCPLNDSELPSERITKLIEKTSRLAEPETRETKIVSDFVETITKTCRDVQNELIKKFDSKKMEWETQKDVDIQNLQEQINLLTEQNVKYETALKEIKEELAAADEAISKLKSQLSTTEIEKVEIEIRCRKLEENTQTLQAEIDNKQTIVKELDELKIVRQEIEMENGDLKQRITESEEVIIRLKKSLEIVKEEQIAKETKIKESQTELDFLKKEKEGLTDLTEKLEKLEKNNRNLMDVVSEVQTRLGMPEDFLSKVLSGSLENNKMFSEKIEHLINSQLEGLNLENKHLKLGNDSLKEKVKQLTKLIGETANSEAREEMPNLNVSNSMSLRSKPGRKSDLCVRRLDKLEEINHNLTELITRILTMTEFPDTEKLKFYSVREFPKVMKKVIAHLDSKLKELKEENAQLDEECETYANIIKDLKKEAVTVWKTNKEKTEAMEEEIERLKEEKNFLEREKKDLLAKISKMDAECEKLKSSKSEGAVHNCTCDTKKVNELKRAILMKEQKLLELQDLEAQASSYKSQIEYLKNALEREKKKIGEEKEKNKKLQNELNEAIKNQKTENKNGEENLVLDELRMRGSISGGVVQEIVDKEKMKKLAKDIGILKELCRARYAEIKRLEAENAALKSHTPKNSNQMDSPIRSRVYNTRSKNPVRDLWKTELSGKENSAV